MKRTKNAKRFAEAVGLKVRALRTARGLGQVEFGKKLETDAPTVSRIEKGRKVLRVDDLYEVGRALDVPPRVLVDVEG